MTDQPTNHPAWLPPPEVAARRIFMVLWLLVASFLVWVALGQPQPAVSWWLDRAATVIFLIGAIWAVCNAHRIAKND